MAWYTTNSGGRTHPVGEKKANDFGLHDMHGNVWEWCRDRYQKDFYKEPAGARDPLCENSRYGSQVQVQVLRGGSWNNEAWFCRSAIRLGFIPPSRDDDLGFRPAWSSP